MRKVSIFGLTLLVTISLLGPGLVWAAGGGKEVTEIVVVADTRVLESGVMRYFADTYNSNILLFAIWSVVLTAVYGAFLGFVMDLVMSRTGLDLRSRKIVEH